MPSVGQEIKVLREIVCGSVIVAEIDSSVCKDSDGYFDLYGLRNRVILCLEIES